MSKHDGHVLKYVMLGVDVEQDAVITPEGNIETTSDLSILKFADQDFLYCDTCEDRVVSGEDGLDENWEIR